MIKLKRTPIYAGILVVSLSLLLGACGQSKSSDPSVEHTYQDATKDENGFKGTIRKMNKSITEKQEDEFMVYIFATSCPHCAKFKSVINEYAQKKDAMDIYAYDLDDKKNRDSIAYFYKLYGNDFQGTPTLLHIKNGELVNEYIGEQPLENIPLKTMDSKDNSDTKNTSEKSTSSKKSVNSGEVSSSQTDKLKEGSN